MMCEWHNWLKEVYISSIACVKVKCTHLRSSIGVLRWPPAKSGRTWTVIRLQGEFGLLCAIVSINVRPIPPIPLIPSIPPPPAPTGPALVDWLLMDLSLGLVANAVPFGNTTRPDEEEVGAANPGRGEVVYDEGPDAGCSRDDEPA